MNLFAELIEDISHVRNEQAKTQLVISYFLSNDIVANKNEALNLFLGNLPNKCITNQKLKSMASELTGFPDWIIERSEEETGNFLKTLSLLLANVKTKTTPMNSMTQWISRIVQLSVLSVNDTIMFLKNELPVLETSERYFMLKLLTGSFKPPLFNSVLIDALAQALNMSPASVSVRLHEMKSLEQVTMKGLNIPVQHEHKKVPQQFPAIKIVAGSIELPEDIKNWNAYGYREGLIVQLIKFGNAVYLWSTRNELIADRFPEVISHFHAMDRDFLLLGQLITKNPDTPMDRLIARIDKKSSSKKGIKQAEAQFEVWDAISLEKKKNEIDNRSMKSLNIQHENVTGLKKISSKSQEDLKNIHQNCRALGFSGILLRNQTTDKYVLWKAASYSINALLMYIEFGSMKNEGIQSMTFGVYHKSEILPIAKINKFPGTLNLKEIIDFVRNNTLERFGPVRTIRSALVYQLCFDDISPSCRRKSGLILKNVRIKRKIGDDPKITSSLDPLKSLIV